MRAAAMPDHRFARLSHYARRTALALGLLATAFAALFVSLGPTVEAPRRPEAADIAAAREVWRQLKDAKGATSAERVRADNQALDGIVALASDATGYARFEAGVDRGVLSAAGSLALPAGLWINTSARVVGEHSGFPALSLKVGRVRFPLVAGRWAADLVRLGLRLKGVNIPPLDDIVRHVSVTGDAVLADLVLPADSGVVNGIISAGGQRLNEPLVSDIYCRVAARQRGAPVDSLAQLVRRTFDPASRDQGDEYSRAAFVALSMLVVGELAAPLAPRAAELSKDCPHPQSAYRLQQREDLAKHWAFSAGLTAVLGGETAASLGEWKELDDSLADGTGFSFVDLAADRSGMRFAQRTLDPASAQGTVAALAAATDELLLPGALLRAPEGLAADSFVDRYGALDRDRYRRAVESIDRTLAQPRQNPPPSS
jgi:hypothetical protein